MTNTGVETDFSIFDSRDYLKEYYYKVGKPGDENYELLRFFKEAYQDVVGVDKMVEFGGGPTVYQLISAAPKVGEIHFTDYLPQNLKEIELWKQNADGSFGWRSFVQTALLLEGRLEVDEDEISRREEIIRNKITKTSKCDAFQTDPLGSEFRSYYDLLSTNFCPDSITSDKETWKKLVGNICSLLKPHGTLVMTTLTEAEWYYVGEKKFPAVSITKDDIQTRLAELGFEISQIQTIPAEVTDKEAEGYEGMIFLKAVR